MPAMLRPALVVAGAGCESDSRPDGAAAVHTWNRLEAEPTPAPPPPLTPARPPAGGAGAPPPPPAADAPARLVADADIGADDSDTLRVRAASISVLACDPRRPQGTFPSQPWHLRVSATAASGPAPGPRSAPSRVPRGARRRTANRLPEPVSVIDSDSDAAGEWGVLSRAASALCRPPSASASTHIVLASLASRPLPPLRHARFWRTPSGAHTRIDASAEHVTMRVLYTGTLSAPFRGTRVPGASATGRCPAGMRALARTRVLVVHDRDGVHGRLMGVGAVYQAVSYTACPQAARRVIASQKRGWSVADRRGPRCVCTCRTGLDIKDAEAGTNRRQQVPLRPQKRATADPPGRALAYRWRRLSLYGAVRACAAPQGGGHVRRSRPPCAAQGRETCAAARPCSVRAS